MKNIKYFLAILLFVIVASLSYYYKDSIGITENKAKIYQAVSERTSAFIVCENSELLNAKLDNLNYLKNLNSSIIFAGFKSQLELLDSFQREDSVFIFDEILYSLNNSGSFKLGFLTIASLKQPISKEIFEKHLKTKFKNIREYNFQDEKIFTTTYLNKPINFSFYNNLLLYSIHATLIEESLNNLKGKQKKTNTKSFAKLVDNQSENDLRLFVDYKNLNDLEAIIFESEFLKTKKNKFKNVNWSCTNIVFNQKFIQFKNTYAYKYNDHSAIDYVAKANSVPFTLDQFLPNNTAYFEAYKSKNNRIFESNDIAYKYFLPWLAEEIAFFCLETFDEDYEKRAGLVLKTTNIDTAKVNLYLLNKEMKPVDQYEGMAIYEMNVDAISKIFKNSLISFKKPYFAFMGKYLVFANDKSVLRTCYQKYKNNKFLKGDLYFQKFIENNGALSNRLSYINPQRWEPTINYIFNENICPKNFGNTKMETFVSDTSIYSIGEINFNQEKIEKTAKLWELNLDTVANFKPQIVINADTKRKEIITQDLNNKIYLVNQSGEILFKKTIDAKIIGDVYQIDYFKTNKLQYVFNTANKIYVIDRNGKILNGFPLKLPAEASNGMLVVNYDKAKIYRYFVACQNNKIYGYEANGKPLDSWSPLNGDFGLVENKVKHASFNGKDYIYFNNKAGTFYALNRKGEPRFQAINFDSHFAKPFEKTSKGFINLGEGSIYKVDLKGKTTAKIVGDKNYIHLAYYAKKAAFAIANGNEFRVAKSKWILLGKRGLNDEIISISKEKIQEKTWFLVQGKKSVYLINELGEIHPSFPMLSNAAARIEKFIDAKNEILILNEGVKLKAFELVVPL